MKLYFENFRLNESLNDSFCMIKDIIKILNESSMSDEDKQDSLILKGIYDKYHKRPKSYRLTKDEKEIMNKYGLKNPGAIDAWNYNPEMNLADRARKIPEREYSKETGIYRSGRHNALPDKNIADIIGRDEDKKYDFRNLIDSKKTLLYAKDRLETASKDERKSTDFINNNYDEYPEFFNKYYGVNSKQGAIDAAREKSRIVYASNNLRGAQDYLDKKMKIYKDKYTNKNDETE